MLDIIDGFRCFPDRHLFLGTSSNNLWFYLFNISIFHLAVSKQHFNINWSLIPIGRSHIFYAKKKRMICGKERKSSFLDVAEVLAMNWFYIQDTGYIKEGEGVGVGESISHQIAAIISWWEPEKIELVKWCNALSESWWLSSWLSCPASYSFLSNQSVRSSSLKNPFLDQSIFG